MSLSSSTAAFDLLNYTAATGTFLAEVKHNISTSQAVVTLQLRRYSSYYTVMFIVPSGILTMLALFGECDSWLAELTQLLHKCVGMFAPAHSTTERELKVDTGPTALLTMSIVMLSISDMIPKTGTSTFPFLG